MSLGNQNVNVEFFVYQEALKYLSLITSCKFSCQDGNKVLNQIAVNSDTTITTAIILCSVLNLLT